ncbi:MAG TPA: hypothetical protein EYO88_02825, partial [Alphaproteobacteria bacterium]|nr:hypothetical protein [Alphaproteobacteria bacterium]
MSKTITGKLEFKEEMHNQTDDWIPEIRVSGTVAEAGEALGEIWAESLRAQASARKEDSDPW